MEVGCWITHRRSFSTFPSLTKPILRELKKKNLDINNFCMCTSDTQAVPYLLFIDFGLIGYDV